MEHLLLTALDESRHLVVLLGKDGRVLHANRAALRAGDLGLDEASGHLLWKTRWCCSVDDTAQVELAVRRALAGEPTRYEGTFGALPAGSVDLCVTPVRDATGTVAAVLVEGHDIGEWKATERALRESEEKFSAKLELASQLREAQRLEALGTLAGGIAHDFNNILTAIVAFSDLIDMEAESPTAVRGNLIDMRQATARATDLVRQILTFCRRKKQERRPTRLATVTLEVLSLLRSCLPATIQFDTHVDPRAPVVLADPSRIHQVLMNLGTNAAHAMKGMQGKLTVRLDCVVIDENGAPGRPELGPGRYARLLVGDSGRGMDPAIQRNVFEPFFTTKGPGEGTGLGLTVVRGIVQEHDGHVFIDSRPGNGTTFTIFLQEHPSELDEAAVPSLELQRGRGERVLVVDDERMLCDSLALLLERLGYRVSKRSDPVEALELFARDPMSFDVVLADLTMPGTTGVELARAMLDLRPRARILLMTGFSGITSADAVRDLGIQAMVPKPVSIESLTTILRRTLEGTFPTTARKPKPGASPRTTTPAR